MPVAAAITSGADLKAPAASFAELPGVLAGLLSKLPRPGSLPTVEWVAWSVEAAAQTRAAWLAEGVDPERLGLMRRVRPRQTFVAGMNTVGVLLDRLTILLVRADRTGRDAPGQEAELVRTLSYSLAPGRTAEFTKVEGATPADSGPLPATFAEAAFDLLAVNAQLWDAQEVIYRREVEALPEAELRGYVRLFARLNVRRNRVIEKVEELYWS